MPLTVFAKRLREARETLSMSQKDLAKAVGVTPTTVSAYEKSDGERGKKPNLENAQRIASALCVSLDWLCGLSDAPNKETRTSDVLSCLFQVLSNFHFEIDERTVKDRDNKYVQNLLVSNDYNLFEFIKEYKKIETVLLDENYPEYLKVGLKNTFLEKYKDFKIYKMMLYSPDAYERIKQEDERHPF